MTPAATDVAAGVIALIRGAGSAFAHYCTSAEKVDGAGCTVAYSIACMAFRMRTVIGCIRVRWAQL